MTSRSQPGSAADHDFSLVQFPANEYISGDVMFIGCRTWTEELSEEEVDGAAERLARAAVSGADAFAEQTRQQPRVAFLSYSTSDSDEEHPKPYVKAVERAARIARRLRPDLQILGRASIQFDAAVVEWIYRKKVKPPASEAFSPANVFIFPNYASYEIARDLVRSLPADREEGIFSDDIVRIQTERVEPRHPFLQRVWAALRSHPTPARVIFPESSQKILEAVRGAVRQGLVQARVIAQVPEHVSAATRDELERLAIDVVDPIQAVKSKAGRSGICLWASRFLLRDNPNDGMVAGADSKSGEVVMIAAYRKSNEYRGLYDYFGMLLPHRRYGVEGLIYYVGCASHENPNAVQLAEMAVAAAESFENISRTPARVAVLAPSRFGPDAKLQRASELIRERRPDLRVSCPIGVASAIESLCNVFVFPDLNAGNISYKLTERMLGAKALGPILLGTRQPISDLSRGADSWDILQATALVAAQIRYPVLVLNCGSSSVKYQLIDMKDESLIRKGAVERIGDMSGVATHKEAIRSIIDALPIEPRAIRAIGHRVVHGGEDFKDSVLVDAGVKEAVRKNIRFAPLHNPANLMGIEACEELLPGIPQVGVFDTAFHHTIPASRYLYAAPYDWYSRHGVRKYCFHGTSHRYVALRASQMLDRPLSELKIITCHLGNGCSITAVEHGQSVANSLGMTPLEGLVMGTRSGDIDPAVIEYMHEQTGATIQELIATLNKKSGLLGLSGISNDMRDILREMEAGNRRAQDAFDVFVERIIHYIGGYAALMNGVDAIVFTGGIGENVDRVRRCVGERFAFLGLRMDEARNRSPEREKIISADDSRIKLLVIPTNEELMIARDTVAVIRSCGTD